jgi:hypothetical protein
MRARRMPFVVLALFLGSVCSAAFAAENAAPLPAPGAPSKPPPQSNSSDDNGDLGGSWPSTQGGGLKPLRSW